MTVHAIRTVGDPVLRTVADPVTTFDASLAALAEDMHETMNDVKGVGLAGPQIGISKRIFTYNIDGHIGTVCNPVLEILDEETVEDDRTIEGCLSVPGIQMPLARPKKVRLTGVDITGEELEIIADGLLARCFQHETDHLNGKLFIDRLTGEERRRAQQTLRHNTYQSNVDHVQDQRAATIGSAFSNKTGNSFLRS